MDVPRGIVFNCNKIVRRAQFVFNSAWFGQQLGCAGNFGGATRRDGSSTLQSPRAMHPPVKHDSRRAGTQTSCFLQAFLFFANSPPMQLGNPHHKFVHFGLPFSHTQALQFSSSWVDICNVCDSLSVKLFFSSFSNASDLYGESVVVFMHTDVGSESTMGIENI